MTAAAPGRFNQFTQATLRRVACEHAYPPSMASRAWRAPDASYRPASTGCQGLTGNSADRVAFGLREGANRLGQSRNTNDSITVRIPSRTWPNGCPGAYRVQLLADSAKASGIVVSCLPKGATYTSLHAKRFVHTPVPLEVEQQAGQPVEIVLQKRGKDAHHQRVRAALAALSGPGIPIFVSRAR